MKLRQFLRKAQKKVSESKQIADILSHLQEPIFGFFEVVYFDEKRDSFHSKQDQKSGMLVKYETFLQSGIKKIPFLQEIC